MKILILSILAGALFHVCAAETLKAGDPLPPITAKDQHGTSFELEGDVRFVLIAFDMQDGKAANRVLAEKGGKYLPEHRAVFVSNIHGMPGIGRTFALPKMRKYPHRIILADSETMLAPFPRQENRVTVLTLDPARKITAVRYWNPAKEPVDELLSAGK